MLYLTINHVYFINPWNPPLDKNIYPNEIIFLQHAVLIPAKLFLLVTHKLFEESSIKMSFGPPAESRSLEILLRRQHIILIVNFFGFLGQ